MLENLSTLLKFTKTLTFIRNQHRRNYEILEEEQGERIAMVMRRRRLKLFGHVKR